MSSEQSKGLTQEHHVRLYILIYDYNTSQQNNKLLVGYVKYDCNISKDKK